MNEPVLNTPTERALYRDCEYYKAERDCYREALYRIAAARGPLIEADPATLGHGFEQIARDALDAGSRHIARHADVESGSDAG